MIKIKIKQIIWLMITGSLFMTLLSLAHANTPKILVIMNDSEHSISSEHYALQAFLAAWCGEAGYPDGPLSLPINPPQSLSFSINGQAVNIQVVANNQISMSDITADSDIISRVVLTPDAFEKMSSTTPLPIFTLAVATVPLNFIPSSYLLSLLPNDLQVSSAVYRLLSHDGVHRYAMLYQLDQRNTLLFSSLVTETDNFQRMGGGVHLDGSPNINAVPTELVGGFPIYDHVSNLFETQKGLTASIVGQALQTIHTDLDGIVLLGTEASVSRLYTSFPDHSTACYGVGELMNDATLQLPVDIPVQLVVPALAPNRDPLKTAHIKTFNTPPPFHFSADYGYDAGLFLKALIEQQVLSQTTLDRDHIADRAASFAIEGITGAIGPGIQDVMFNTILRECLPDQDCQWVITQKTLTLHSRHPAESAKNTDTLPGIKRSAKKQTGPKMICILPESQTHQDEIDMAQSIKKGLQLATTDALFTVDFVDSYDDANHVRSLFYGDPHYQLTQEKMASIEQDNVPAWIITAISSLIGQTFETEAELLEQLVSLIGSDASNIHGGIITYHAYVGDGIYDLSDVLAIVTLRSSDTEAITILPEKRDILIVGPATDSVCNVRPNILNFFPKDQQVCETLEARLSKLTRINSRMHRYMTIVQSDPSHSPSTQGVFHNLISNNNFFESIIRQYDGCDPRLSGDCHAAPYPHWIGTLPFYGSGNEISIIRILESLNDKTDHLIYMGNSGAFSMLMTALSSIPDLQKKLWTATPGLDRPSIPQVESIDKMRLQVVTFSDRKQTADTIDYAENFFNAFGYVPGRYEYMGYDIGRFLVTVTQSLQNEDKALSRANLIQWAHQMNTSHSVDAETRLLMPKAGQWTTPSSLDYNEDGQTSITDAIYLLKKCAGY